MIYRLHIYTDSDGSEGYEFFRSYREARARRQELLTGPGGSLTTSTGLSESYIRSNLTITSWPVPKTKDDLVHLLNKLADHPDNG